MDPDLVVELQQWLDASPDPVVELQQWLAATPDPVFELQQWLDATSAEYAELVATIRADHALAAEAADFPLERLCLCGCGEGLTWSRGAARYYSGACRQRAYRRRLAARSEAS